jgi:DNA-binding XRE family transcriptional regulator
MPAPKKHTQFIFDDIEDPRKAAPYGFLGMQFEIFKNLAEIRIRKGLTQHDLAKKSDVPQPTIARIEAGRANPNLMLLIKISHALDHKIKLEPAEFAPGDYEGYME